MQTHMTRMPLLSCMKSSYIPTYIVITAERKHLHNPHILHIHLSLCTIITSRPLHSKSPPNNTKGEKKTMSMKVRECPPKKGGKDSHHALTNLLSHPTLRAHICKNAERQAWWQQSDDPKIKATSINPMPRGNVQATKDVRLSHAIKSREIHP